MDKYLESLRKKNSNISDKFAGKESYWWRSPSNMLLKQGVTQFLEKYSQGGKVLDAGAGRLAYRPLVEPHFSEYLSTDFKQTHPDLTAVADITEQPFKDSSLDFIFCSQVLEHVPRPWLAVNEFARLLKPGGRLLVTVPMLGYIHNAPYDFYRYTKYGLTQLGEDAGLKVLEIKPLGGLFCFIGYIRSTILIPLFGIPVLGKVFLGINSILNRLDILLDKLIPNSQVFPLNYIVVMEK